jgi:hypothetical protein
VQLAFDQRIQLQFGKLLENLFQKQIEVKAKEVKLKGNICDPTFLNIAKDIGVYEIERLHYSLNQRYSLPKGKGFDEFLQRSATGKVKSICWNYCVDALEAQPETIDKLFYLPNVFELRMVMNEEQMRGIRY